MRDGRGDDANTEAVSTPVLQRSSVIVSAGAHGLVGELGGVAALGAGLAGRHVGAGIDLDGDDGIRGGGLTVCGQIRAGDLQLVDLFGLRMDRGRNEGPNHCRPGSGSGIGRWILTDGDAVEGLDVVPSLPGSSPDDLTDALVGPLLDGVVPRAAWCRPRVVKERDDGAGSRLAGIHFARRNTFVTKQYQLHSPRVRFAVGCGHSGQATRLPRRDARMVRCDRRASARLDDVRSIIWDMGGTLVDTYPEVDQTLAEAVWPEPTEQQLYEVAHLRSESIAHAIEVLAKQYDVSSGLLDDAYTLLKKKWAHDPAPLMAGAAEVMAAVRRGGGLNLVATHRDRASAENLFHALGVQVDDLVCAPDGFARKPDPR